MPSSAADVRNRNRKTVVLPSGNSYLIRKLDGFHFRTRGILPIIGNDALSDDERKSQARAYLIEHPDEVTATEDHVLLSAVLAPRLSANSDLEDGDVLSLLDLGDDRDPLLKEIADFSGQTAEKKSGTPGVREEERVPAGDAG